MKKKILIIVMCILGAIILIFNQLLVYMKYIPNFLLVINGENSKVQAYYRSDIKMYYIFINKNKDILSDCVIDYKNEKVYITNTGKGNYFQVFEMLFWKRSSKLFIELNSEKTDGLKYTFEGNIIKIVYNRAKDKILNYELIYK